jgi:8-oxo-dGTP diphosphatase
VKLALAIQLATSILTLYAMWLIGRKDWRGWVVGLANQVLWIATIITAPAWGIAPLCVALIVVYTRALIAWRRDDEPPLPLDLSARPKREWVVGFLLDDAAERVVLIRKNRPEWQAGKLNGVGGKVEADDADLEAAMVREFWEETGVRVNSWHHFARLEWEEGTVHFFRAFRYADLLAACRTTTDETIELHPLAELLLPGNPAGATPNLLWLVPLAAHRHDSYDLIDVVETGTTMRKPGRLDVLPG